MVCMGLGIAVGIFLSGSVSGAGLIMALCLFSLFSGLGIYFGFKGAALFAFGCAAGLLRTLFGPVSLPYGLMYPFEHMRAGLSSVCASLFGEHAPLLNAMLWGVKGGISDSVYDAFRSCGIAHILALSGLHVSHTAGATQGEVLYFDYSAVCLLRHCRLPLLSYPRQRDEPLRPICGRCRQTV